MCGRTACTLEESALSKACVYKDAAGKCRSTNWQAKETGDGRAYCPSYNLPPKSVLPCIISGRHFKSKEKQVLYPMIWGMIRRWEKGDIKSRGSTTHNARMDGLLSSVLYSYPLSLGKRCVIVCDGYYEWKSTKHVGKGVKQPYFVYAKQEEGVKIEDPETWKTTDERAEGSGCKGIKLLKLAGIFDTCICPEGKNIYSCSMITRSADDVLSWLHHRVPVFLETDEEVDNWLDYENIPLQDALEKLHGPRKDFVGWHRVGPIVNNSRNDSATCYQPIDLNEKKPARTASGPLASWLKTGVMIQSKKRNDEKKCDSDPKRWKPE